MAVINSVTNIATMLQVYAYKAIPAFVADLPPRNMFTLNFDESIGTVGQSVVTRLPTTNFGSTLNDLSTGWCNLQPSSSNVTTTLAAQGYDHPFNITTWQTIGEQQLINTFANTLQKQVANGIFVQAANLVTSSVFTNTVTVTTSSLFSLTGSTGLQGVNAVLDNLEVTQVDRYAMLNPIAYQGLVSTIYPFLTLGNSMAIVGNGFAQTTGNVNNAWPGIQLAGTSIFKNPRISTYTALTPLGGAKYSSGNKLAGWVGNPAGIVLAARPFEVAPSPLTATVSVIEPSSGFPLTYIIAFDSSLPGFRIGCYSLFGVAAGNTNAIVPILTTNG